jgi:DNA polymerase-3 subunit delta'
MQVGTGYAPARVGIPDHERGSGLRLAGVRGHDEALERLARAIARAQLHHSMIFVGPRGVGKATVARALARGLHCKVEPAVGCRACTSCRRIDADLHAGVEWIRPETTGGKIKVEVARELATRLLSAPFEGDAHLVVVDTAEALTEQAWNALLKTIEEPRPGVHFVSIAQGLDGILPTILSRSAVVRFGRISDDDVVSVLDDVLTHRAPDDDGVVPEVPAARRELAMRLADGSPGLAVELALDASLDGIHRLLAEAIDAVRRGPAAIFAGDRGGLGQAFAEASAGPTTGKPARERQAIARMSELWLLHLRERMRGREGEPDLGARTRADDGGAGSLQAASLLLELQDRLERNANARLVLEHALLELEGGDRARP